MQASAGRRERIQQRYLYQVEVLPAAGDEASRLRNVNADVRGFEYWPGDVGEVPADEIDHLRVDLDRVDPAGALVSGKQHV